MRLVPASPEIAMSVAVARTRVAPRETPRAIAWRSAVFQFRAAWFALVVLAVLTRLPFMTRTLYAFDSANYALAVRDFYNVAFHQPHPPGYPLYVFFARAINVFVNDANRALVLEGIVWSAIGVACTVGLGRALFGRGVGLLAGALLLGTVGFWGYAEVAYPYVALAGETAAIAWLVHAVIGGRSRLSVVLGVVWAISAGVRWDAAVFCSPLALWALSRVSWRRRAMTLVGASVVVAAWTVPMIALTGGWDVYRQAFDDYLKVWSPQSAYVVGDFASGGDTQATYNLNFLVNYLRQMLGIGLILVLYVLGKRFGPARLATDYRSRFLALWLVPPLLTYVFVHLGEAGYVLSLAPVAAILIAVAIADLRDEVTLLGSALRTRGWAWMPPPRALGFTTAAVLAMAIVGWNTQAFLRGVGPGRLPDLRAHDATTSLQMAYVQQQDPATTLVLAHDIVRQAQFYLKGFPIDLLYSEYVPDFQTARTRSDLPPGVTQVVVLDAVDGAHEVVLNDQPRVSVWILDARGARAVEHGYRYARAE